MYRPARLTSPPSAPRRAPRTLRTSVARQVRLDLVAACLEGGRQGLDYHPRREGSQTRQPGSIVPVDEHHVRAVPGLEGVPLDLLRREAVRGGGRLWPERDLQDWRDAGLPPLLILQRGESDLLEARHGVLARPEGPGAFEGRPLLPETRELRQEPLSVRPRRPRRTRHRR